MTAANAFNNQKTPAAPNQESRSREPSMEDILASIRRIIADDQVQAGRSAFGSLRRATPPSPAPGDAYVEAPREFDRPETHEEVLDLAKLPDAAVSGHDQPPQNEPAEGEHAAEFVQEVFEDHQAAASDEPATGYVNGYDAPASTPVPVEALGPTPRPVVEPAPEPATSQVVRSASAGGETLISPKLGASVMSAFETLAATVVLQNTDMLNRVMHDLMRPMLKDWLDENLPSLVERLVRTEIERVARGGRG